MAYGGLKLNTRHKGGQGKPYWRKVPDSCQFPSLFREGAIAGGHYPGTAALVIGGLPRRIWEGMSGGQGPFLAEQDDCRVPRNPLMVSLSNHRQRSMASFDRLTMSGKVGATWTLQSSSWRNSQHLQRFLKLLPFRQAILERAGTSGPWVRGSRLRGNDEFGNRTASRDCSAISSHGKSHGFNRFRQSIEFLPEWQI